MQQMQQIKQMIALAMLAVCAYTDIRERNIYLAPLVISVAGGVMTVLAAFWFIPEYGFAGLIPDLVVPALAGALIVMIVKLSGKYIGDGDGYMMASLGILIGNAHNLMVLVTASVAASMYAAVLVIGKKKRRIIGIPFAPFVLSGYMAVTMTGIWLN